MAHYESRGILDDQMDTASGDREISLSPGIVLGVFLALALVCAVFFGFGYSVGRRSVPPQALVTSSTPPTAGSKPSPTSGFAEASKAPRGLSPLRDDETGVPMQPAQTAQKSVAHKPNLTDASGNDMSAASVAPSAAKAVPVFRPPMVTAPTSPSIPSQLPAGSMTFVQVAAFSHQQDADLVAGALRKRGYDVSIRQQPQDSLLHVQLGPFGSKKEAELMRQRLQSDGYNAIVK